MALAGEQELIGILREHADAWSPQGPDWTVVYDFQLAPVLDRHGLRYEDCRADLAAIVGSAGGRVEQGDHTSLTTRDFLRILITRRRAKTGRISDTRYMLPTRYLDRDDTGPATANEF